MVAIAAVQCFQINDMKLNVELLKEVARAIVEHGECFDMDHWFREKQCNSTACIAGWTVFVAEAKGRTLPETLLGYFYRTADAALGIADRAELLLFGRVTATNQLFYYDRWPKKFREALGVAGTPGMKAKVAADYIHYFIKKYER